MGRTGRTAWVWAVLVAAAGVHGQDSPTDSGDKPGADKPVQSESVSVTKHTVTIGGREIEYTAAAGYMELPNYEGKPRANIFYVAYTLDGIDPAERPVTFTFNGGPGSSSVWLHMGALGPRRIDMGVEGFDQSPPFRVVPNEHSWLDLTDLVFIDPVSTGYSRPVEGQDAKQFHGLEEDLSSVGDFIRLWTTRHERWLSPKFLAGESYGTTRAAGLSAYLQDTHGMYLNGLLLISSVLNFQTIRFGEGNDDPYWLFLPTYTATAWYHNRLDADLQRDLSAALAEVERWASTDYLLALAKGDALTPDERRETVRRLARYTGLSERFVELSGLRIDIFRFTKELLRDEGRTVGRLDSRFKGMDRDGTSAGFDYDPSMTAITGPYTAGLNDYVRRELGYRNDLPYEILTGRVHPWSYRTSENRYVNVATRLRDAMHKNPALMVFVASGYYDLATPYFATDNTLARLGVNASLRGNIRVAYYQSGHMMYIREDDLAKLKRDVAPFYTEAARVGGE
ncbi:MAG: hypothetical protein KJZ54_08120 [Phycisphaerales bacterium]|nr:hypothetical protein [Phycisphaerales bacterium]